MPGARTGGRNTWHLPTSPPIGIGNGEKYTLSQQLKMTGSSIYRNQLLLTPLIYLLASMKLLLPCFYSQPHVSTQTHTLSTFGHVRQIRMIVSKFPAQLFNPRPSGGGRLSAPPPPLRFYRIEKIRRRAAPPGFHPPYPHLFRNFCENFKPIPCEVRSSGQVK